MLSRLRKIDWPQEVDPVGGIISAKLIGQVADYEQLIWQAEQKAELITKEAQKRVSKEIEQVRQDASKKLTSDFTKFKQVLVKHRDQFVKNSSTLCFEVTKAAVNNYLVSLEEEKKLKEMVGILIEKLHTNKNLIFEAHPNQVSLVGLVIEGYFSNLIKKGDYEVRENNTLVLDQLRVSGVEDAFIDVSINNLLLIINNELELVKEQFGAELEKTLPFKQGEVNVNEAVEDKNLTGLVAQKSLKNTLAVNPSSNT